MELTAQHIEDLKTLIVIAESKTANTKSKCKFTGYKEAINEVLTNGSEMLRNDGLCLGTLLHIQKLSSNKEKESDDKFVKEKYSGRVAAFDDIINLLYSYPVRWNKHRVAVQTGNGEEYYLFIKI